ncbi:MAG: 2-C-methyl-D-erythritol 4-phosphate cytidylyltransferase [Ruminococcaceae bacterium]|nr:2-C-methyl-D-erythritol 4-phosphate cytidylyltransferase [Oscillospiraceae bacterium]
MFLKKSTQPRFGVVIVAGGSSSRMKGVDKQTVLLGDMPVPIHSVLPFSRMKEVTEIVIVCREDLIPMMMDWVRDFGVQKVSAIVRGGSSRQQSVLRGIDALSENVDYFAIHDGARPFADEELIRRCMQDAMEHGAATAAVPCKDTIKVSDSEGFICDTPDRSTLHQTQTPQIFRRDWYLQAAEQAKAEGVDVTDDCQLLERAGRKVHLSMGSYFNIKITTQEDLPIAFAIAQAMEQ